MTPDLALSHRLAELRVAAGMTQAETAAAFGVHVSTWARYERGEAVPVAIVRAAAILFGVTTDRLLGLD